MPSTTRSTPQTFADLGLPDHLIAQLATLGFDDPTPIQAEAIPILLSGRDLVGVAQTGTGKTAAFGLPMLTHINASNPHTQALVLVPTRELALQVQRSIESFAWPGSGIETLAVYGGAPYGPQERGLRNGAHVVVGTPGRIIDHIDRHNLDLSQVSFLVLDEGDEMLRMGFAEDVDLIMSGMPAERQMALFSATMPDAIRETAANHLHNPAQVAVTPQSSTVDAIEQFFAIVPPRHKLGALARVLATSNADASLVFVRTRADAEEVCTGLVARGVAASVISGDVSQIEREKVVSRIRSGLVRTLVATDVAARGLDIDRIGLVVNYDLPHDTEYYVHRIGRTGRAGRTGVALSFVGPKMVGRIQRLEKTLHIHMAEFHIPTPAEVSAHRISTLLASVPSRIARGRLDVAVGAVNKFITANPSIADATQIIAAIAAIAVGDTGASLERDERDQEEWTADRRERTGKRSFEPRGEHTGKRSFEPRGEFRSGPRKPFLEDGVRRPFREDSPHKPLHDPADHARRPFRDRDDSPRRPYREDGERRPLGEDAPRRPYREDRSSWSADRSRGASDESSPRRDDDRGSGRDDRGSSRYERSSSGYDRGASRSDRTSAPRSDHGAPRSDRGAPRETTKPWGRTERQPKRHGAASSWGGPAKPRKKKH